MRLRELPDNLRARIKREGECWIWTGAKTRAGYGTTTTKPTRYVHRLVWELVHGPIPAAHDLHHDPKRCGNRACCRPSHLSLLSKADHTRTHKAKLTAEDVAAIRAATGPHLPLAERYGVTRQHIANIRRGNDYPRRRRGRIETSPKKVSA